MSQDKYIRKGTLLKCPHKPLNPFKQKWQSRWFVLYDNSEHGRVRIEYYDSEKFWQQEKSKRVISLSNCVSIKLVWNKEYNHVIEIVIPDRTIHLAAQSKEEQKLWFKDMCEIIFGNSSKSSLVQVVKKLSSEHDIGYHSLSRTTKEEIDNSPRSLHTVPEVSHEVDSGDLLIKENKETRKINKVSSVGSELSSLVSFESGFDDASSMTSTITEGCTYPVSIRATIASQKAGMNGKYLLQVTPLSLLLIDIPSQCVICEWPIQFLRRYGRGRTKFSFEASEKCKHGKGVYTFDTLDGDSIFHIVHAHVQGISAKNHSSVHEGFKPIGRSFHNSEGKLLDKLSEISFKGDSHIGEGSNDVLNVNPSDSVSQSGTLQRSYGVDSNNTLKRDMSIGSGISLEIAQNISDNTEESKHFRKRFENFDPRTRCEILESSFDEEPLDDMGKSDDDDLVHTLDHKPIRNLETLCEKPEKDNQPFLNHEDKKKKPVKRSSSLKLFASLKPNSSKELKKSNSVRRSSSFRNRFFKSKSTDVNKDSDKKYKNISKSDYDLTTDSQPTQPTDLTPPSLTPNISPPSPCIISKHNKVKEIIAKAIEDDMSRSSETEFQEKESPVQNRSIRRKFPVRHKSNEMLGNGNEKNVFTPSRLSSSFAGYDYRGNAAVCHVSNSDKDNEIEEELKRLQRRTQSVMRKVELYEGIRRQADEHKINNYTFWRKRQQLGKY
uniref:Docking protein 1 n=1 Tax=Hydra vulgaris TaxID=6087 RepID=T2M6N4_HYDVU